MVGFTMPKCYNTYYLAIVSTIGGMLYVSTQLSCNSSS